MVQGPVVLGLQVWGFRVSGRGVPHTVLMVTFIRSLSSPKPSTLYAQKPIGPYTLIDPVRT